MSNWVIASYPSTDGSTGFLLYREEKWVCGREVSCSLRTSLLDTLTIVAMVLILLPETTVLGFSLVTGLWFLGWLCRLGMESFELTG